jgi:hypothetical protein
VAQAIGQVLSLGVGVALSPVPIIAVVLLLGTPRARINGPAFLVGWILGLGPAKAFGMAALLSGVNPKNLLLTLAAASAIAQTGIDGGEQAVALAIFVIVGTLGPGAPVAIYFAMGARAKHLLDGLKAWMGAHNAAIMAVLCLVIGAKLIGDAITQLG